MFNKEDLSNQDINNERNMRNGRHFPFGLFMQELLGLGFGYGNNTQHE